MKKFSLILLIWGGLCVGQDIDADEIMRRVDANGEASSRIFTSKMVIHGRRGSRTVVSKSWAQGEDQTFTEYLAPAREKGVKMLKLKDQLWT